MTTTMASAAATATKRPLRPEDLLALRTISDAQLSPDGQLVAFTLKTAQLDRNDYASAIWLVPTDGAGEAVQLTAGSAQDTAPRWSPDGTRLAFVSDRSGEPQLYVLERVAGGWSAEPRQVTRLGRGAGSPIWSPDGTRLAFVSTEGNGLDDAIRQRPGGFIRHVTRLRYRFDVVGYTDGRFNHLWVVDAAGGEPVQVTRGEWDDAQPAWSPDGTRLAFVSNRRDEANTLFRSQLYVVRVPDAGTAGSGESDGAVALGTAELDMVSAPVWSPDGGLIAVIGRRVNAPAGANTQIWVVAPSGGPARPISAQLDRSPGTANFSDTWTTAATPPMPIWTPAGDAVLFTANDQGRVSLFRADLAGTVTTIVAGDRSLAFVTAAADGDRLAFAAGSFTEPCDVYTCRADGRDERRLTRVNAAVLAGLAIQHPEPMPFPSYDGGFTVDAWLIRPVGYEAGRQYPLIQIIHGGPHSIFGHVFFFDMQLWASHGYHVLFINPRASQGYGEAFATCNLGKWGVGDGPEQLTALDLAIEKSGVDPNRLAVTGLSYGGFMTNWLIGQTDRFKAAVSENGICNLISFYGTSDIGWAWQEHELFSDIWNHLDDYMRLSPITYMNRITTPTLLLQAETDWRCPIEQGEQFYTALRAKGVPTEMLRFPGDSHTLLSTGKPESRLERRRHTLRWWQTYL